MEERRFTRKEIIDALIAEATGGMFTGDDRDGEPPPITLQNFGEEAFRYAARPLRARLSSLSDAELLDELQASAAYVDWLEKYKIGSLDRLEQEDREAAARAHSERQAERGRRHALQPAILAAAQHYRANKKTASRAWQAIRAKAERSRSSVRFCWYARATESKNDRVSK